MVTVSLFQKNQQIKKIHQERVKRFHTSTLLNLTFEFVKVFQNAISCRKVYHYTRYILLNEETCKCDCKLLMITN